MLMRSILFLIITLFTVSSDSDPVKKELALFQGDWQLDWVERNGIKNENLQNSNLIWTIRGNKTFSGEKEIWLLKLDPTCNPKLLDLTNILPENLGKDVRIEAIYKIEGDTFLYCWYYGAGVKQRPLEFKTERDSERAIFAFKRVKQ